MIRLIIVALLSPTLFAAQGGVSPDIRAGARGAAAVEATADIGPPARCPVIPSADAKEDVAECGEGPCVVNFRYSSGPNLNPGLRQKLKDALARDFTTVRLGPDIEMDFSVLPLDWFPMQMARCTTLTSVSAFEAPPSARPAPGTRKPKPRLRALTDAAAPRAGSATPAPEETPPAETPSETIGRRGLAGEVAGFDDLKVQGERAAGPARTPRSLGPVLKFGPRRKERAVFIAASCYTDPENPAAPTNDGVRISGFRLFGPSFGQQTDGDYGIRISRCVDVEISNMEIAGWGEAGVSVVDDEPDLSKPPEAEGGRIRSPSQIRVFNNYIHHNQQPNVPDGHAGGYGVAVSVGGWALITENVFDHNRHAIEASGKAGGYDARRNLVLKGGGIHGEWYNETTHQFDVHGTGSNGLGGTAGNQFWYYSNAFQYRKDNAIKIRGRPRVRVEIAHNVFPHPGFEDDWGDDAVNLDTTDNVVLGPGNIIERDTFGRYGVCDFDGDEVDDLFLATGASWWYSSYGEFHWSYLDNNTEPLKDLRFGYFDDDKRCDVLAEKGGRWVYMSGGYGDWKDLGAFGAPLSEVEFGRFDPSVRDQRPGATRKTTHAFRRMPSGEWQVTDLSGPNWRHAQSSRFPLSELRFGDFTGDGVTDVLAVENGRWAISESGQNSWRRLNPNIGEEVKTLFIANMDPDDNIDDILKLERKETPIGGAFGPKRVDLTWRRSKNGTGYWETYKTYSFTFQPSSETVYPGYGHAGRFGAAPGGATLVIDPERRGQFYGASETAVGASPDWSSLFPY